MAIGRDELGRDERIVVEVRTHVKSLFGPVIALLAATIILGAALALMPPSWRPWSTWGVVGAYALFVIWGVVVPFLRWLTSVYAVTNQRVITRGGIINKTGHDLPLRRINNVNFERSLTDRMFGCGTLILETAAGQPLVLPDVPHVAQVHVVINELLFGGDEPRLETGEPAHYDD